MEEQDTLVQNSTILKIRFENQGTPLMPGMEALPCGMLLRPTVGNRASLRFYLDCLYGWMEVGILGPVPKG